MKKRFTKYLSLTKPGIVRGNAYTAAAGYFLAANGTIDWSTFIAMLAGLSLVIASGCVFNNYIDQDIDQKMTRTKKRALITGEIKPNDALVFGFALGIAGTTTLTLFVNGLTTVVALTGFLAYVAVYGIAKRKTVYGTAIGSISGAIPPVVGYTAASDQLDIGAGLLFAILVFWQMAHFYSIALLRAKEYAAANIPVYPLIKGVERTKGEIMLYIVGFTVACTLLTISDYTSAWYAVTCGIIGLLWLGKGWRNYGLPDKKWGGTMFGYSLLALISWSLLVIVDSFVF